MFGVLSSYHYEYGSSTAYGSKTSVVSLGASNGGVGAPAQLEGLQPGASYHFRVVVENEDGVALGGDEVFSTFPQVAPGLPDGRGYEMVTPVASEGKELYMPVGAAQETEEAIFSYYPFRAAADGDAIAYVGEPNAEGNGSQGINKGNEFIATRSGPGTWVQRDVQPPGFASPYFVSFSEDLSSGVLFSTESLSAGAPAKYENLYVRDSATGSLQPFSKVTPPNRPPKNGPEGFGAAGATGFPSENAIGRFYAGASRDSKHLFFEANDALTANAIDGGEHENNLYESTEGTLRLVNVLPGGEADPNASFGAPPLRETEAENTTNVISADGSRVFWTDLNTGSLYARENEASTVLVGEHATFQTASTDGSRVFYVKGGDLYEDDLSGGSTTDLTPAGEVMGVAASSDDASYLYVVAMGSLAPGATVNQSNLYLLHAGTTTFIATLGPEKYGLYQENPEFKYGFQGTWLDWSPNVGQRTAEATPDGHALVFMSRMSLTGYDNLDEQEEPTWEVYTYEADTGKLSCASCSPSGEPPRSSIQDPVGALIAPFSNLAVSAFSDTFQLRSISDDGGRVFFESSMPLVAQDVNGRVDVYEWERDGAGNCRLSSGCVYLISGGVSQGASYFLDASMDGSDVFFMTRQKLVEQDQNELYDVYDARIGVQVPPTPSACTGSGCQGAPGAPPVFATPSSVTFAGVGNLPAPTKPAANAKKKSKHKLEKKKRRKGEQKAKRNGKAPKAKKTGHSARKAGGR
ncbi:MAG: hypothetical protein WBV85_09600 [Solirubrobacteraceae bacterium]